MKDISIHTYAAKRGFSLVGVMVASVIMVFIIMGMMKSLSSTLKTGHMVGQITDFESVKSNVKVVVGRQVGCNLTTTSGNSVFQTNSGDPIQVYADETTTTLPDISTYDMSRIALYGNPAVSLGDNIGAGLVVNKIAFDYDRKNAPRTVVSHFCEGPGGPALKNLDSAVMNLRVEASSPGTGISRRLEPLKISVLSDPTTHKVVGYDLGAGVEEKSTGQICLELGFTWDNTTKKCMPPAPVIQNPVANVNCPGGTYLSGFDSSGSPICPSLSSIPVPPAAPAKIPNCKLCSEVLGPSGRSTIENCVSFSSGGEIMSAGGYGDVMLKVICTESP